MSSEEELVLNGVPICNFKVVELKKELEVRGLDKKGNKKDLYDRLRNFLLQSQKAAPKTAEDATKSSNVNPLVVQYLKQQEMALKVAGSHAEMVRQKTSDSEEGSPIRRRSSRLESESSNKSKEEEESQVIEKPEDSVLEAENNAVAEQTIEKSVDPESLNTVSADEQRNMPQLADVKNMTGLTNGSKIAVATLGYDVPSTLPVNKNEQSDKSKETAEAGQVQFSDQKQNEIVDSEYSSASSSNRDDISTLTITNTTRIDEEIFTHERREESPEEQSDNVGNSTIEVVKSISAKSDRAVDDELDYDEEKEVSSPEAEKVQSISAKDTSDKIKDPGKRILMNAVKESKKSTTEESTKLTEGGLLKDHPSSPARYPVSKVIHIRCLKRPFLLKNLKDLLSNYGTLVGDVWLDDIKSQCIAKFETEEQAESAREKLHNVQWPTLNDRFLRIDYTTEENLTKRLTMGDTGDMDTDALKLTVTVENKELSSDNGFKHGLDDTEDYKPLKRRYSNRNEDEKTHEKVPKLEQPPKTLETLFRKTLTQPALYYLPLSDEEAEKRAEKKEIEEKERRRAIESRGSPDQRRRRYSPPPYRRNSPRRRY